jgi:nitrogen fixation protein FixH
MKMPEIPPKYFYPGMVIGLLLMSVGFVTTTVIAAHSDGGPQVVEDYYQKSVDYDETQARREAAANTGWTVEVTNLAEAGAGEPLLIEIVDRKGQPVTGLEGTLELRRPELARAVGTSELTPAAGKPGFYEASVAAGRDGLWDIEMTIRQGESTYLFDTREELE